jgi:hypothetical protein
MAGKAGRGRVGRVNGLENFRCVNSEKVKRDFLECGALQRWRCGYSGEEFAPGFLEGKPRRENET